MGCSCCEIPFPLLLNTVNPFRIEGQKTVMVELMDQRDGTLGNTPAFGKALREMRALWLISRLPRLAVEKVDEQEIADAKAVIGLCGVGCEPASAATLAGIRKLTAAGVISPGGDVVGRNPPALDLRQPAHRRPQRSRPHRPLAGRVNVNRCQWSSKRT